MKKDKRFRVKIRADISADQLRREAKLRDYRTARRFEALAKIIEGTNYADIARDYKVSTAAVYHWIHRLNERGIQDFERKSRNGRRRRLQIRNDLSIERLENAAEMAVRGDSLRLLAMSMLLSNKTYREVSQDVQVSYSTLVSWAKKYNSGGIECLLNRKKNSGSRVAMRQDFSIDDIRRAAWCARRRTARRLLGISYILEGMTLAEAAKKLDVSVSAISKWCHAFNAEGIEGVTSKSDRNRKTSTAP